MYKINFHQKQILPALVQQEEKDNLNKKESIILIADNCPVSAWELLSKWNQHLTVHLVIKIENENNIDYQV